jgi:hypothetical protein
MNIPKLTLYLLSKYIHFLKYNFICISFYLLILSHKSTKMLLCIMLSIDELSRWTMILKFLWRKHMLLHSLQAQLLCKFIIFYIGYQLGEKRSNTDMHFNFKTILSQYTSLISFLWFFEASLLCWKRMGIWRLPMLVIVD